MASRPTFPIAVNILVLKDGKLLLGQRVGGFADGLWCLPGGHLEHGESLTEAAKRELLEETGIVAEGMSFESVLNETSITPHYVHFCFRALNPEGAPSIREPEKFKRWEWFSPNDLPVEMIRSHSAQLQAVNHRTEIVEL